MGQISDFLDDDDKRREAASAGALQAATPQPATPPAAPPASAAQPESEISRFLADAPPPERGLKGWAQDIGATAVKGLIGAAEAGMGLTDLATGGLSGRAAEGLGLRFKDWREKANDWHSEATKEAQRQYQQAEGVTGKVAAALQNPSVIASAVGEALPQMFAGGLIGRGLMLAGRAVPALAGRIGPALAGALGEGIVGAGSAAEQIRQESPNGLLSGRQAGLAGLSGVADAGFGLLGGKMAQRLGIGDVETMLAGAGRAAAKPAAQPVAKGLPRQMAQGALSEGVLEELPQSVSEQALQNIALDRPWQEDVDSAAVLGTLSGGVMGAGASGLHGLRSRPAGAEPLKPSQRMGLDANAGQLSAAAVVAVDSGASPAALAAAQQGALQESAEAQQAALAAGQAQGPREAAALERVAALDEQLAAARQSLAALDAQAAAPDGAQDEPQQAARAQLAQQVQQLQAERESLTQDWPRMQAGKALSFGTESGAQLAGHWALAEADQLVTSHDEGLRQNPAYPQQLQPRERSRAASEAQIARMAQRLQPERLAHSADAATGAPIVGADGLVESGNARSIAIKRVYAGQGPQAAAYKDFLQAHAAEFGLTPEQVAGMQKPVLVRVRDTPVNRAEFARQANAPTVAMMSPAEQARADAARMDSMDGLEPDESGDFSGAASRGFVRRFMARLPVSEQAAMVDADGRLSSAGYARVRNAVLAKAWGTGEQGGDALARMTESLDDNTRSISRALMMAAPETARMREAIAAGARHDADIAGDVAAAAQEISRLREAGQSVQQALAQTDAFGDKHTPETRALMQFMADNARRPRRIAQLIQAYWQALDAAGDPHQQGMFGGQAAPTKQALLQAAMRQVQDAPAQGAAQERAAPEREVQESAAQEKEAQEGAAQEREAQDRAQAAWNALPPEGRHQLALAAGVQGVVARNAARHADWSGLPAAMQQRLAQAVKADVTQQKEGAQLETGKPAVAPTPGTYALNTSAASAPSVASAGAADGLQSRDAGHDGREGLHQKATPGAQQQFEQTAAEYGGRAAYEKARAAGRTKLDWRQWVQVRTPAFKAWFGDWQAARAKKALQAMPPVEVPRDGVLEKGVMAVARQRAREMYRQLGTAETADGRVVRFPMSGFKETAQHAADRRVLLVIPRLPVLLEQAHHLWTEPSSKANKPNVLAFHHYGVKASFGGRQAFVRLVLREDNDGHVYYDNDATSIEALDAEKAPADERQPDRKPNPGEGAEGLSGNRLAQWWQSVKPENVSKVIDPQTGEPLVVYHGSRWAGFTQFGMGSVGATAGTGAFFTESARVASTFSGTNEAARLPPASQAQNDGYINERRWHRGNYAVFLNIRAPAIYDFQGRKWDKYPAKVPWHSSDAGSLPWHVVDEYANRLALFATQEEAEKFAHERGDAVALHNDEIVESTDSLARHARRHGNADGALFQNVVDGGRGPDGNAPGTVWVAFRGDQIKSATDNTGAFDAAHDDIRFSREQAATESLPGRRVSGADAEAASGHSGSSGPADAASVAPAAAPGRDNAPHKSTHKSAHKSTHKSAHESTHESGVPRGLAARETADSRQLEGIINRNLERSGQEAAFKALAVGADQLPDALRGALAAFERATGARAVVFRNLTPHVAGFNGVTVRDGTLFINETSQSPITGVAAHEWLHNLRRTHPALYHELAAEVARQGDAQGFARQWGYAPGEAQEELTAAAVGDAMTDPQFLARLAEQGGSLFARVAKSFLAFLDTLTARWRSQGSNAYLRDVQAFRDKLAAVLQAYEQQAGQAGQMGQAGLPQATFQRVWHGTPHKGIEKTGFRLDKIGTGEGLQVYGHGIYFASRREVAEFYRGMRQGQVRLDGRLMTDGHHRGAASTGDAEVDALLLDAQGDVDQAIAWARDFGQDAQAAKLERLRGRVQRGEPGQLYAAEIPEDDDLLDWDKPLDEQPAKVRRALLELAGGLPADGRAAFRQAMARRATGQDVYAFLAQRAAGADASAEGVQKGQRAASELLLAHGIPGLRYLDGDSRNAGEGSHNYVIWDEGLLTPEAAQIAPQYSRQQATKAAYDKRIDALFAGGKAQRVGQRVLDRSDVLGLLGHENKPVLLQESKVLQGQLNHPRMTAHVWKQVPEWLENPAAVFESDTEAGRLVAIAPETLDGAPVSIIIEPKPTAGGENLYASLLVNAYDRSGATPFMRWIGDGLLRYVDKKKFPAVFALSVGRRLPDTALQNKPGTPKILTEKNLDGWRRANPDAGAGSEASAQAAWDFGGRSVQQLARDYAQLPGTDAGHVIDVDMVRELSPQYRADRSQAARIHRAASDLSKELFAQALARPVAQGRDPVAVFTAGGGGSGKSTAIRQLLGEGRADVTLDGTLSKLERARQQVQAALDSGRNVQIRYVYRSPAKAAQGAIERAIASGRPVPVDVLAQAHANAPRVVKALAQEYAGHEKVEIIFIHNDGESLADAFVAPVEEIPDVDEQEARRAFESAVDAAWRAHHAPVIHPDPGQSAFAGRAPVPASAAQRRDASGANALGAGGFSAKLYEAFTGHAPPGDEQARFSRRAPEPSEPRPDEAARLKESALEQLDRVFKHPGTVSWWHKTVGTMRNLAERQPLFKPVYEAAQQFIDDVSHFANDAADFAPRLLPRLESWRDLGKRAVSAADSQAVAAPLFEGTLSYTRGKDGSLVKTDNVDAAGVVFTDAELKGRFGLTPAQIELYRQARAAIDRSIDTTARADILRLAGRDFAHLRQAVMDAPDLRAAAVQVVEAMQEVMQSDAKRREAMRGAIEAAQERVQTAQALMQRGYAPLTRFGRYTLDVVDAQGQRQYFGLYESRREANVAAIHMRSQYPGAQVTQGTLSDDAYKLFAGITPESLELFGDLLAAPGQGKDKGQDKAFQAWLQLARNNRSAIKRLIHRKGVAGYSQDAGRVLASFIYANARQTAGALNAGRMDRAIAAIPKEQGQLRDVAMALRDYTQNPREEGQAIRGMLFAQYLGGSLASAAVNMTQPFAVTLPWLSQFGGMRQAAAQMTRALADMTRPGHRYEADLARDMAKAEEDGVVSPQEIHQLMAQARGAGALRSGDGTRRGDALAAAANAWERLKVAWGQPFALAEQFNRRSTYIAAWRLARQQGMADADAFARRAVLETQFVYTKANKPRWGRGAVGGALFTFKTYSVSYLELMHRMWTQGGTPGKQGVAWMLAMLLLMGGAGGLPFMEDAEDLVDGLAQLAGYNTSVKQWRRQALQDIVGNGLAEFIESGVSGLPGAPIDISGRLGMGNLLPGTGLLLTKQNRERDLLDVAGPAGDLLARGFAAGRKLLTGDAGGAAMELAPTAARNLAKGADMLATGSYRDAKGYKVLDTTALEALAKAAGFQPRSVAQVQEGNSFLMRSKSFYQHTSAEIKAQWARALFEKDEAALQRVRQRVADWNRRNPEQPITVRMPDIWRRVREMGKERSQRIADSAPRALRQQMRQALAQEG